jgi:hypothetical protein
MKGLTTNVVRPFFRAGPRDFVRTPADIYGKVSGEGVGRIMSRTLRFAYALAILGTAASAWGVGCSSDNNNKPKGDAGPSTDGSVNPTPDGGDSGTSTTDDGGDSGSSVTYVLLDDFETTTHGPIELDSGFDAGESPAYWYNFGDTKPPEAGAPFDTADPPLESFVFSAVIPPTTTLGTKMSAHAAHQACLLNKLYDVCGIGVEFAQVVAPDAGDAAVTVSDASVADGGDAAPPIPKVTVPFDISRYKGITFWARTALPDDGTGVDVKVAFPNTQTDPRGGVCDSIANGASFNGDTSLCYNSYAKHVTITGSWQPYTVLFSDLQTESFGFVTTVPFTGTDVYGINWQEQDNAADDAAGQPMDLWIDDVFFIE